MQAVHVGHRHVEDDHVGAVLVDERHGFGARSPFADDLHPGIVLENPAEALSHERMVIDHDDANGTASGGAW